tara:strand:- start:61 stop:504 length:444 start_codon:yes stop_codon:yes gene_type:complete
LELINKKMKTTKDKVYSKLAAARTNLKSQNVELGLVDEFEYTSEYTNEMVGLLDYTTDTWFDEKFDQMMELYNEIYDVYVNNTENYLQVSDVANDQRLLDEILTKSEELGLEVADVYPEWYEHSDALEYLNGLEARFEDQKNRLPKF